MDYQQMKIADAFQCSHELCAALYRLDNQITFNDPNNDIKHAVNRLDAELKGMSALIENWKKTVQP
jgi:hypothetical protein